MKQALTIYIKILRRGLLPVVFLIAMLGHTSLMAQTDSIPKEEAAAEEESSLIAPSIEFISIQKGDNTVDLKASLKAKVNGSFRKLPLLKVTFLLVTDSAEIPLGFGISDRQGVAVFTAQPTALPTDKDGKLHFKAVFAGNKSMDAAEEEVTIKRARLEVSPVKGDSLNSVTIKLIDIGSGTETPVPEILVGLFVRRSFNPLKLGEGTTDESGEASVEIPGKLPGDAKGNITLLARLDENEVYGNLETGVVQPWGIAVSDKNQELPRALWSPHPPLWMIITFAILMTVVWGHYIVIIYELFRLRKEEPHPAPDTTIS